MQKFLIKIVLLFALFSVVATGIIGIKLWRFSRDDLRSNGPVVKSGDRVLFVGSSSIGCAITPRAGDRASVFWRWKLQPQYFLIELEKLEQERALEDLNVVVVEFGFQNFAYQTISDMTSSRVETLPLTLGRLSRFPLVPATMLFSVFDCIRLGYRTRVTSRPDPGISLADRSDDWQREKIAGLVKDYFEAVQTPGLMCDDWQESLKSTYGGIVELCRQHKIRPMVLLTPMPRRFRDITPVEMKKLYEDFVSFFTKVGFTVIDGSAVMDDRAFMDVTHLSQEGSKLFTDWVVREIRK